MTMMKMLIVRDEPVTQHMIHGYPYYFKTNEHGDKVCDVLNQEHVHMMETGKGFCRYEPPGEAAELFDEEGFVKQWEKLAGDKFCGYTEDKILHPDQAPTPVFHEGFVHRNLDKFYKMGKANKAKALTKWNRQTTEGGRRPQIWPGRPLI
jgi:hypothetical protein